MLAYSQHMAAYPKQRISIVDPWPSDAQVVRMARAWFAYYTRPSRPFPAANYCPLSAKPAKEPRRLSTEHMPAMSLEAWQQEQWLWMDRKRVRTRPARKVGRFERLLDKLIAWRQGWRSMDDVLLHS